MARGFEWSTKTSGGPAIQPATSLAILFASALTFGVALLATGGAPPAIALTNCSADTSIDSEEQAFVGLINQYRGENGLGPLVLSPTLSQAAAWKSQHMADHDYFAHDDIPIGRTWVQRLRDCDYTYNTWLGENLAAGDAGAGQAFAQWRNSPPHSAIMLSEQFMALGIARAFNDASQSGWYWTAEFGGFVDAATPTPTPTPAPTATPTPTLTVKPPDGDTDGDTIPNSADLDDDNDGCLDAQELGGDAIFGGQRDPHNFWDWFDPNADGSVTVLDFFALLQRFAAVGDPGIDPLSEPDPVPAYHTRHDRGAVAGNHPWNAGPPDGAITVTDFFSLLAQFGHSCA